MDKKFFTKLEIDEIEVEADVLVTKTLPACVGSDGAYQINKQLLSLFVKKQNGTLYTEAADNILDKIVQAGGPGVGMSREQRAKSIEVVINFLEKLSHLGPFV